MDGGNIPNAWSNLGCDRHGWWEHPKSMEQFGVRPPRMVGTPEMHGAISGGNRQCHSVTRGSVGVRHGHLLCLPCFPTYICELRSLQSDYRLIRLDIGACPSEWPRRLKQGG